MNDHADFVVKITNAGGNTGQEKRIKSNLKTVDNQIPILSGTSKDHKVAEDEMEGPDVRPIMGATVGPNVALTNFIGKEIVKRVAEDADSGNVCKSVEELLGKFEEYNKNRVENGHGEENIIVGSMDIEKWYPKTKPIPSAKTIKQMILNSKIKFDGINYEEVAKYLGKYMTIEEILEVEMEEILHGGSQKRGTG